MLLLLSQQETTDPRSLIDRLVEVSGLTFADAMLSLNHLEIQGLVNLEWDALQATSAMTVTALGRSLLIAAGLRRLEFTTRRSRLNPTFTRIERLS